MSTWERQHPAVWAGDEAGGDAQIGTGYSARWVAAMAGGEFAMVTRTFYVAQVRDGEDVSLTGSDEPYLECGTEYLICTDPTDPGTSEVWSDSQYWAVEGDETDAAAEDAARHAPEPTADEWASVVPWAVA